MSRNEIPSMEATRGDIGRYYKSQPSTLNLAYATIPEDDVWNSSPVVCADEFAGDADKQADGFVWEIDMEDIKPLLPLDGGWGWMIALASFVCMFLVDGICFSYGIFLSELQSTFGATKMQMALAGSLLTGCYFMTGPISSGLMNRYGARKLVIAGSLISSVAIFSSSFSTDVNTFIALFGILGGLGFGLLYLPACTVVSSWFVKKRATVNGIVTAGSGIGITCYSLLIPYLIEEYTWRGCIILLAGINLNGVVAGALLRPLWNNQPAEDKDIVVEKSAPKSRRPSRSSDIGMAHSRISIKQLARQVLEAEAARAHTNDDQILHSTTGVNESMYRVVPRREHSKKSNVSVDEALTSHANQLLPVPEGTENVPILSVEAVNHIVEDVLQRSTIVSTTSLAGPTRVVRRRPFSVSGSQRWFASTTSQLGQMTVKPTDSATVYLKPDHVGSASYFASSISLRTGAGETFVDPSDGTVVRDAIVKELRKEVSRPVHKKDLFLSGSVLHLNEYVASPNMDAYVRNVTIPGEEVHARNPIKAMLRNMFSVSILRSPTFQLLNVSSMFSMIGFVVPYQFLKDNAQAHGFEETESAHLLAYLGVLNTISRVLSGLLSDRPWIDVVMVNNVSLILSGLMTTLVPFFTSYPGLLFYACFFGFVIAAFVAVRTILVVKVLGLDRLTNAIGFLLLFQGFTIVAAPPLFGAVYDALNSFTFVFVFGGIALVIAGILCIPLNCLMRWEQRKDVHIPDEAGPSHSKWTEWLRRLRDRWRSWRRR